jgi:hypothetical protein
MIPLAHRIERFGHNGERMLGKRASILPGGVSQDCGCKTREPDDSPGRRDRQVAAQQDRQRDGRREDQQSDPRPPPLQTPIAKMIPLKLPLTGGQPIVAR